MVLYDSEANFLAISDDSIKFLGYEDANDFKKYVDDVADLFLVKSGYVYKFNNFSWIDYILHSGAANKSAIVRLKNGNEIEVDLHIKEVYFPNTSAKTTLAYEILLNKHSKPTKTPKIQAMSDLDSQQNHKLDKNLSQEIHTQPKKIKLNDGIEALGINTNTMNIYIKDYLKFADIVDKKMISAINWRSSTSIKRYVIQLKSISDLLRLDTLSRPLVLLLDAAIQKESQEELSNTYKKYRDALQYAKESLMLN